MHTPAPHSTPRLSGPGRARLGVLLLTLAFLDVAADARGEESGALPWLIVQPGYPGTSADAAGFLRRFRAYLTKHSGLQWREGAYHNVPEAALEAVMAIRKQESSDRPAVALVSPGFYLRYRDRFGFMALAESRPAERLAIVVREDYKAAPHALKGAVAGGPLYEPVFLERVAFPELPVGTWKLRPTLRPSRALRFLARGRHQAVVLNGRQLRGFRAVLKLRRLKSIAESASFPPALLVTFCGATPSETQRKLAKGATSEVHRSLSESSKKKVAAFLTAFLKMGSTEDGRKLLNTMGAAGFREVRRKWLKRLEGTYNAGQEEKRGERAAGDGRKEKR